MFFKKVVCKKVVSICSKVKKVQYWSFCNLGKFFSVYVLKIQHICVQNVMYVTLATL